MIRVEIDPLFSDELAAFKAHRRHRRVHLVLALTSAAAVLAVLLYNLIRYDKPGLVELVVLPSAYVALVLLGLGWDRLALWFRWRAKNKRIPGADMTITAIYSDEGAEVVNYLSRMFVKWEVFSHYVESSEVFLLYTDRDQYVYVPKRVMTLDQVVSFRELMSRQVMLTRYQRRAAQGFPVERVSAAAARAEARDNSPPSR